MAYPDTSLASGALDPAFGGQTANAFGAQMRAFIDAQIRELERQVIADQWQPYRFVRVRVHDAVIAGDCLFFDLAGAEADYTVSPIGALSGAYSATVHIFAGIAMESGAVGSTTRMIIAGCGIPPAISGLASGTSGPLTYDTATGRLKIGANPNPLVGYVNDKGYCSLRGRADDHTVP